MYCLYTIKKKFYKQSTVNANLAADTYGAQHPLFLEVSCLYHLLDSASDMQQNAPFWKWHSMMRITIQPENSII